MVNWNIKSKIKVGIFTCPACVVWFRTQVGDSTGVVDSLSPTMRYLIQDAVASRRFEAQLEIMGSSAMSCRNWSSSNFNFPIQQFSCLSYLLQRVVHTYLRHRYRTAWNSRQLIKHYNTPYSMSKMVLRNVTLQTVFRIVSAVTILKTTVVQNGIYCYIKF